MPNAVLAATTLVISDKLFEDCKAVSAKAPWAAVAKAVASSVEAVPRPSTNLAAGASAAVITPTIGEFADPVPPLTTGNTPSTSSAKSTLLIVKVWPVKVI